MDIKIRCPNCETKLVVEDDLLGQSVLCEECDRPFTVEAPPAIARTDSPRRAKRDFDDDFEDREYEFDDGRPIRRKPRAKPNTLVPIVFGSSILLATALMAVGLIYAFGFTPGSNSTPVPPGAKFRLSNVGWLPNHGFAVDVETVDGGPPPRGFRIAWRTLDGRGFGNMTLPTNGTPQTVVVPTVRGPNQSFTIWIENEPPVNGVKQSNVVTLK